MTDQELIQALRDEDITDIRDMMNYMEEAADRLEALLVENEAMKDREKAYKELKQALERKCAAMEAVIDHLREATKMIPKWRPASEPPETIPCIAGTEYSEAVNVLTSGRKVLTAIYNGHEFIADVDFWEAWDEEITHWAPVPMPLPSTEGVE